jgi:hypothetical protein
MPLPFASALKRHAAGALAGMLVVLALLVGVGVSDFGSLLLGLILPVAALFPGVLVSSLLLTRLAGRRERFVVCPVAAAVPGLALALVLVAVRSQDPSGGSASAGEVLPFAAWLALWPALTALAAAWGPPERGQAGSARSLASR